MARGSFVQHQDESTDECMDGWISQSCTGRCWSEHPLP